MLTTKAQFCSVLHAVSVIFKRFLPKFGTLFKVPNVQCHSASLKTDGAADITRLAKFFLDNTPNENVAQNFIVKSLLRDQSPAEEARSCSAKQ
jgi:hypothetical protein